MSFKTIDNVPAFLNLVREVYASTIDPDSTLRKATVTIFKDHLRQLLRIKAADDLLLEISSLGRDLARLDL
jgi:hypothetical protein